MRQFGRDKCYSQEGEEDDGLDAEELGQRSHAVHVPVIGPVEENQTVHGHRLADVCDQHQVGVGDTKRNRSFAVDTA